MNLGKPKEREPKTNLKIYNTMQSPTFALNFKISTSEVYLTHKALKLFAHISQGQNPNAQIHYVPQHF